MKLVVITPTLGQSPWLAETVASVAQQSVSCTQVLVAPETAVRELAGTFPTVQVIAEPAGGRGMYAAINAGARAAGEWDFLTYLNDDDLLLPAFSRAARAWMARSGARCIGYGGVRLIDVQGRRLGAIPVSPQPLLNRALYAQRIEPVYQHGTLISRAVWDELGGFDEQFRFCGDSEFLARACVRGVPFVRGQGGEVAAFRLRAGQLTKSRSAMRAERAAVDAKLGLLAARRTWAQRWARWVFRAANTPVYLERIARHGLVSFDELLARVG
jgi:GT2 family glycosyltransferase